MRHRPYPTRGRARTRAGTPACTTKEARAALKWTRGTKAVKPKAAAGGGFVIALKSLKPAGAGGRVCVDASAAPAGCQDVSGLCGGASCAVTLTTAAFARAAAFGGSAKGKSCCALSTSVPPPVQGASAVRRALWRELMPGALLPRAEGGTLPLPVSPNRVSPHATARAACPDGYGGGADGVCRKCALGTAGAGLLPSQPCTPCGNNTVAVYEGAPSCSACPDNAPPNADRSAVSGGGVPRWPRPGRVHQQRPPSVRHWEPPLCLQTSLDRGTCWPQLWCLDPLAGPRRRLRPTPRLCSPWPPAVYISDRRRFPGAGAHARRGGRPGGCGAAGGPGGRGGHRRRAAAAQLDPERPAGRRGRAGAAPAAAGDGWQRHRQCHFHCFGAHVRARAAAPPLGLD
jgi:hypothetical protein